MGASISYKYSRKGRGLWMVLLGIPLLILYGTGLILIIIGAIRMRGSGKASKIRKTGQDSYGRIAYKIKEHNERITLLNKKRVVFYYKLENGLLGRTFQFVDKKTFKALSEYNEIIPIKVLGNQAVINIDVEKVLENKPEPIDDKNADFSSQEPAYRYRYGEVTKKSIVLLSIAAGLVVFNSIKNILLGMNAVGTSSVALIFVTNILIYITAIILYIVGVSRLPSFGVAKKIRKDGNDGKFGKLIPIVDKKNGNTLLVLPEKAIFQYETDDGLLIQTTQVISHKMFDTIVNNNIKEVPLKEINNYAVIDNKELLGEEPTKIDKFVEFVKNYRVFFWFGIVANIYFLVTEIINYVSSSCTDGISLFTIIMYGLTLIYMGVMELLDSLHQKGAWAYLSTLLFLAGNIIGTLTIITLSFLQDGLSFTHTSAVNWYGFGAVYFIYLVYKLTKSIINSQKAKRLDLDYERCQDFGDIVSNFYTFFNYLVWVIISYTGLLTISQESISTFTFSFGVDTIFFILILIVNLVLSIVFITKCGSGISKEKRMKKGNVKE